MDTLMYLDRWCHMIIKSIFSSLILLLMACQALAKDCSAPDGESLYTDKDWYSTNSIPSGDADGRYPETGGTGPFQTIQQLIDRLQPGECGFVRKSAEPYFEIGRKSGTNISGNTFAKGGESDDMRITLSGYPDEIPVINLNLATDPEGRPVAGFLVHEADYVTIRNFEITGATASGVMMNPGGLNRGIIIEEMHIHDLYGLDNIGGVRLDGCIDCIVRNNVIHDIYDVRSHAPKSNPFTSVPHGMHSGVHGYRPSGCIIENNYIYNVEKGVYQKEPNQEGAKSNEVRQNIFENMNEAFHLGNMGSNGSPFFQASFHHNLVKNTHIAVGAFMYEGKAISDGLDIYNNTLVNVNTLVEIQKVKNVSVYNNIIDGTAYLNGVEAVFIATNPVSETDLNEFSYINYNLYNNVGGYALLDRYTDNVVKYTSVLGWIGSDGSTVKLPATNFRESGGLVDVQPVYVNPSRNNYKLSDSSPGRNSGRYGKDLGAFVNGLTIGPNSFSQKKYRIEKMNLIGVEAKQQ